MCTQGCSGGTPARTEESPSPVRIIHGSIGLMLLALLPLFLFVGTAAAQSDPGSAFCDSNMAGTIQNIFTIIQFGGPLIGGVLALGATVAIPFARRSDWKKEMKSVRNQGLLWGVIVAPLGTEIVQFILNNVVVGGTSCGF
ncbi:hypothetical protein [Halorubrum sp. AJ67]|uniref:hypothetical protein n=1 Tax=Halorubrum sp. AJ67 TaxID=1173487 RepID=UPI0003DCC451|nr:putative signal peptide protein [Halorubrum sp. AJ67]